nr:Mobile element protein [Kibdelosporangium sp. MJ126-NF4]
MPAALSSPITAVLDQLGPVTVDHAADLRELLARIEDPRDARGVRHSLAAVLTLAAVAVAAGARSIAAIWEWAADLPQWALREAGARWDPRRAVFVVPSEPTLRRALSGLDGDALDIVVHAWIASRHQPGQGPREGEVAAIAIDGKALRGTFARTGGGGVHLLAGISHTVGIVTGCQQLVPVGTSEVAWVESLFQGIDITDVVITADSLHTTRAAARHLTGRGGHYVFVVKKQSRRLHDLVHALPWARAEQHITLEKAHGRIEHRALRLLPAPDSMVSLAPHRFSGSPATAPTAPPAHTKATPGSVSPASPPTWPTRPGSRPCCAGTGRSKTDCTGSATPPTAKTRPGSAPAPHPAPWPPCATSPSAPYASPAPPTSPKHYAP